MASDEQPTPILALRDWYTRARVRIIADETSGAIEPATVRHFHAGDECVLTQWGIKGREVKRDSWWDSFDIDGAHIIGADKVEVIWILEEVSPWLT